MVLYSMKANIKFRFVSFVIDMIKSDKLNF